MKKIFTNPIFDSIFKAVVGAIALAILYFQIDMRDFVKFRQPERDNYQDVSIQNAVTRVNICDSMSTERNKVVNKRIDDFKDEIRGSLNEIKTDLKKILYKSEYLTDK